MKWTPLFLLLFFLPNAAFAAITIDTGVSTSSVWNQTTNKTAVFVAKNVAAGATLLVASFTEASGLVPTSVQYASTSMTAAGNCSSVCFIYYLTSPATGNNNFYLEFASAVQSSGFISSYQGTATTGVVGAMASSSGANSQASGSITARYSNSLIYNHLYYDVRTNIMVASTSQTVLNTTQDSGTNNTTAGASYMISTTTPSPFDFRWSPSNGGAGSDWQMATVEFKVPQPSSSQGDSGFFIFGLLTPFFFDGRRRSFNYV